MFRLLYNLLFPFVFLLLLPGYLARMLRRGNYRRHFWQRLGFYPAGLRARLAAEPGGRVWIQAVSVGEMLVALKLIAALRQRAPALRLLLSTTTTTGFRLAEERAGAGVEVLYTPMDFLPCARLALRTLRPAALVIVEGGVWPNLVALAKQRGVPAALVEARLSPRSERRFRRFRPLAAALFRPLDLITVPEAADLARWRALGVAPERLRPVGSVKFDETPGLDADARAVAAITRCRAVLAPLGVEPTRPILLAGSTHPGEERLVAEQFLKLRRQFPDLFLLLAPRHVERVPGLCAELAAAGLRFVRRTEPAPPLPAAIPPDALLLDTTGELRDWYALATVAFIGKSLAARGGQNPMEAAAAGAPVLFGPGMENFRAVAAQLLAARAAMQVRDADDLGAQTARLLGDPTERAAMAARAAAVLAAHRGAAARTAGLLLELIRG